VTAAADFRNVDVERAEQLAGADERDALSLTEAADDVDGAYPVSEQVVLRIRHGGAGSHLLIRDRAGELVGYGQVDASNDPATAEFVVHPAHRRHGLGRALATAALTVAKETDPRGRLWVWSHGDHPSAGALALALGFERARVLFQLRRPLSGLPEPHLPDGVSLRAFRPGEDDEAWLDLNARAFADHPEQGRWTLQDLRVRMSEPWFDPAGFLLAVEDATGRLLGFHWTKVHSGSGADPRHKPIGEVYVLGVDPTAHGMGLGKVLTVAGLRHLRDQGLEAVMLYVDESNGPAVALYGRLGFGRWASHVQYRHG